MQFGRDSSVQQINLGSNRSISSSSSKDIVSNAILTNSNKDDNSVEEQPSSPTRRTNTNINTKNNKRPNKIILLGERHSGTNWITNYLKDCFIGNSTNSNNITVKEQYKRFKHWFQQDDLSIVEEDSAVVVSMFRDPMVRTYICGWLYILCIRYLYIIISFLYLCIVYSGLGGGYAGTFCVAVRYVICFTLLFFSTHYMNSFIVHTG